MAGEIHIIDVQRDAGRLDKFLADSLVQITRSQARTLIEDGCVTVNGNKVKPTHHVRQGEKILVSIPLEREPVPLPEELPVDFLYKDDFIAVVNKPANLVTHPAAGNWSGTLVNGLLYHLGSLPHEGQEDRPGIVHRLDKDTSGVLVVARTGEALRFLQSEFARRNIRKEYLAITDGVPRSESGIIEQSIGRHETKRKKMAVKAEGGRDAVTKYKVIEDLASCAFLCIEPLTGRTHQIRVHLRSLGTPVLCDPKYSRRSAVFASQLMGRKKQKGEEPVLSRQALHAHKLTFEHPADRRQLSFEAPLPGDMQETLNVLRSGFSAR